MVYSSWFITTIQQMTNKEKENLTNTQREKTLHTVRREAKK